MPDPVIDERQNDLFAEQREHRKVEQEKRDKYFLRVISVALSVLGRRVLMFSSLILSAGLFVWVMLEPDVVRLVGSSVFCLMTFVLLLLRGERNGD